MVISLKSEMIGVLTFKSRALVNRKTMNTLMTPKVANMLDQLHREADEQMPSVRATVKQIGIEQTSEEWPSD